MKNFLDDVMNTRCSNCKGRYRHHRKRDERCPKNGEYQGIMQINKEEPWKPAPEDQLWESTTFNPK